MTRSSIAILFFTCITHFGTAPSPPGNRVYHCLVYDAQLQKSILLDGYHENPSPEFGEVWGWDGRLWAKLPGKGPLVRGGGACSYDSKRNKLVLFGGLHYRGSDAGKLMGDTWEWDGSKWSEMKVAAPQARAWHSMAYDAARERTVLFGGNTDFGQTSFADTWEWDGNKWTKINVSGPGPRSDFAMVFDAQRKKIVLFGGQAKKDDSENGKVFSDTWTWDGKTWEKISDGGPAARTQHRMVYDSKDASIIVQGGNSIKGGILSDMWMLKGNKWTEINQGSSSPGKKVMHAMCYDEKRDKLLLYGGGNGEVIFSDTWEWDGKKWNRIS